MKNLTLTNSVGDCPLLRRYDNTIKKLYQSMQEFAENPERGFLKYKKVTIKDLEQELRRYLLEFGCSYDAKVLNLGRHHSKEENKDIVTLEASVCSSDHEVGPYLTNLFIIPVCLAAGTQKFMSTVKIRARLNKIEYDPDRHKNGDIIARVTLDYESRFIPEDENLINNIIYPSLLVQLIRVLLMSQSGCGSMERAIGKMFGYRI